MWLVKTEPEAYSYTDLERTAGGVWDGVANPAALRHLREMQVGDLVIVYHTGSEKAAVGVARVTRSAYPDPAGQDAARVVVDLAPVRRLSVPVTLAQMKALPAFAQSPLVRQGRLSVLPLTREQWELLGGGR